MILECEVLLHKQQLFVFLFSEPKDEMLEHELDIADRRSKREIRQLEEEMPRWQAIVDNLSEAGKNIC